MVGTAPIAANGERIPVQSTLRVAGVRPVPREFCLPSPHAEDNKNKTKKKRKRRRRRREGPQPHSLVANESLGAERLTKCSWLQHPGRESLESKSRHQAPESNEVSACWTCRNVHGSTCTQWPSHAATSTCTVTSAANGALEGGSSCRPKDYGGGGDHVGGHPEAAASKWSKLAVTGKQVAISPSFWDVRMWPSLGDSGVGSGRGKQEASAQSGLYNHSELAAQQGDPRVREEGHHQNVKNDSAEFQDITFSNPVHVECSDKSGGKTSSFLNVKRTSKREIPCKREFRDFLGQRGLNSPARVQGHHLGRIGGGADQHGCAGDAADSDVEGGRNKAGKDDQVAQPVLLMLNTDFAVTSPVRENLLLTIALTQRGSPKHHEAGHEAVAKSSETRRSRVQLQVLVGQFKAFSSFLRFRLGADALRVKFEQNAGGSSTISEVRTCLADY